MNVSFNGTDQRLMARAVQLAQMGLHTTDPNPRVGAVLAQGDQVVGEGWHRRAGEPHAEVIALRAAAEKARGATLYVSLEPCNHHGRTGPCTEALIAAGIARVVCSMADPNPAVEGHGMEKLRAAGMQVQCGLLEDEARRLNPGFIRRMERGIPWVRLKLGVSLDGRTALASGESRWITGEAAREDVQQWRARSSAILTSLATVVRDDPRLDVRLAGATRQPLRVILDSNLETPDTANILSAPGEVLILTAATHAAPRTALEKRQARVETLARGTSGGLDLRAVLARLGELAVNELWIESGAQLAGAFIEAGLVDELVIYMAPDLLGADARGMFEFAPLQSLAQRRRWQFDDVRRIGRDLRIVASREAAPHEAAR